MTASLAELEAPDMQSTDGIYHLDKAVIKGPQPFSKNRQCFQYLWIDIVIM